VNGGDFGGVTTSRDFVVTCGRATYRVTLVEVPEAARPLLLFVGHPPPKDRPLRIVEGLYPASSRVGPEPELSGVICFTPGTRLRTPDGARPVETLREGDLLQTADGAAQEILWIGRRKLSGGQMHAMPELRPIRIRGAALGEDVPDADLVVSPRHRILLRSAAARALFGISEVLVAAEDLLNDTTVTRDHQLREVSYIHLLLPRHHVVWANGVPTESFHPASTDLRTVDPGELRRLTAIVPGVEADPRSYGDAVRRELNRTESRALLSETAQIH
jgi:PAS domain-containing protein